LPIASGHHRKDQNSLSKINSTKDIVNQLHTTTTQSTNNENAIEGGIHSKENNISHTAAAAHGNIYSHSSNLIVIHVCDENKKKNQDFKCDRILLVAHMKYFEKYLADSKNIEDIDISVHCDINIFDWLMRYIHRKDPKLDHKNAISILISSDFLQMGPLVEEAVKYVSKNISEIIALPIDMNCLNSSLIKKLASNISLEELEPLKDKKDKLTSKLFMKKLELVFEDESNML